MKRLYDPELFNKLKNYLMKKCCNKEVFIVLLSQVNSNNKRIIISVLENLICDTIVDAIQTNSTFPADGGPQVVDNAAVLKKSW